MSSIFTLKQFASIRDRSIWNYYHFSHRDDTDWAEANHRRWRHISSLEQRTTRTISSLFYFDRCQMKKMPSPILPFLSILRPKTTSGLHSTAPLIRRRRNQIKRSTALVLSSDRRKLVGTGSQGRGTWRSRQLKAKIVDSIHFSFGCIYLCGRPVDRLRVSTWPRPQGPERLNE